MPSMDELHVEARSIVERMTERGLRLATAESTVGGLIGFVVTAVPGASKVFAGGITAYSNRPKIALLGVPEELAREQGAVSEPVVGAMARGAREAFGVDVAVAESGIASPAPHGGKPGGLYYIGIAAEGYERVERHEFNGERVDTMREAASAALALIAGYLDQIGAG